MNTSRPTRFRPLHPVLGALSGRRRGACRPRRRREGGRHRPASRRPAHRPCRCCARRPTRIIPLAQARLGDLLRAGRIRRRGRGPVQEGRRPAASPPARSALGRAYADGAGVQGRSRAGPGAVPQGRSEELRSGPSTRWRVPTAPAPWACPRTARRPRRYEAKFAGLAVDRRRRGPRMIPKLALRWARFPAIGNRLAARSPGAWPAAPPWRPTSPRAARSMRRIARLPRRERQRR